jgi:hypothetical protein
MLEKFNVKVDIDESQKPTTKYPKFELGEEVYYRPKEQRSKNQVHRGKIARIVQDFMALTEYEIVAKQPKHPNKLYVHRLRVDDVFKIEEIEGETKA